MNCVTFLSEDAMAKIIIPQSNITIGKDPNVEITCKVIIKLHYKNKIVQPAVESMRKQLQMAFDEQARSIEITLIEMFKEKKSPGFVKEVKGE